MQNYKKAPALRRTSARRQPRTTLAIVIQIGIALSLASAARADPPQPSSFVAQLASAPSLSNADARTAETQDFATQIDHAFATIVDFARQRANHPHQTPEQIPEAWQRLDYDAYRDIRFRANAAPRFGDRPFTLQLFHPGFLFPEPVKIERLILSTDHPLDSSEITPNWVDPELAEATATQLARSERHTESNDTSGAGDQERPETQPITHLFHDAQAVTSHGESFDFGPTARAAMQRLGLDPDHDRLADSAGFRVHARIHEHDYADEFLVFLGAAYFRLIGREQRYGLSARGLAIDASSRERFPVFRHFWVVDPPAAGPMRTASRSTPPTTNPAQSSTVAKASVDPASDDGPADESTTDAGGPSSESGELHVFAWLDEPAVSGAYHFRIALEPVIYVDVRVRLFARDDVDELGVAPLTSMFWFGDGESRLHDDFRTRVHDSDRLVMLVADQRWLNRSLSNPQSKRVTRHFLRDPIGFALMQTPREFVDYGDAEALYHKRPSLWVEWLETDQRATTHSATQSSDSPPAVNGADTSRSAEPSRSGGLGAGSITLLEIPTPDETHDNIVAYWVPEAPLRAGDEKQFHYRLVPFNTPEDLADRRAAIARAVEPRTDQDHSGAIRSTSTLSSASASSHTADVQALPPWRLDQIKTTHAGVPGHISRDDQHDRRLILDFCTALTSNTAASNAPEDEIEFALRPTVLPAGHRIESAQLIHLPGVTGPRCRGDANARGIRVTVILRGPASAQDSELSASAQGSDARPALLADLEIWLEHDGKVISEVYTGPVYSEPVHTTMNDMASVPIDMGGSAIGRDRLASAHADSIATSPVDRAGMNGDPNSPRLTEFVKPVAAASSSEVSSAQPYLEVSPDRLISQPHQPSAWQNSQASHTSARRTHPTSRRSQQTPPTITTGLGPFIERGHKRPRKAADHADSAVASIQRVQSIRVIHQ
ncbi:MAG: glucan biosynthesis protein [Thioalkalivibrionaceae bacterium]